MQRRTSRKKRMNDGSVPNAGSTPPTQPPAVSPAAPAVQPSTVVSEQKVGKYTVKVLNDKCIGAASCVAIAPGTFKLNEQNIAEVISQGGDPDDMKLLGAQSCPTAAIVVIDNETGQQVWPVA